MKLPLRGEDHQNPEALKEGLEERVGGRPPEWFLDGLPKLPRRCNKCIHIGWEYVEKIRKFDHCTFVGFLRKWVCAKTY